LLPSTWNWTLAIPTLELDVALTVVVPETVAFAVGAVIETVGGATVLLTFTLTPALVVVLFEVSLATAVSVWFALLKVAVFKEKLYGDVVTALPTLLPSTWNWTLAIPTLELAVALTVVVPETVAFAAGVVTETVGGGVEVELDVVNVKSGLRTGPLASLDTTR
jgi:hypothetical protein